MSNHSKIDDLDSDVIDSYDDTIEINIYSKERKDYAVDFLKKYFEKLPILHGEKNLFINKVTKKVIKSKHDEIVINFLKKIKIDINKTDKQIRQSILDYLVKKGALAILKKREYSKYRGSWKLDKEFVIKGKIQSISSTGSQVTINNNTGKDFEFVSNLDKSLLLIATTTSDYWKRIIENIKK